MGKCNLEERCPRRGGTRSKRAHLKKIMASYIASRYFQATCCIGQLLVKMALPRKEHDKEDGECLWELILQTTGLESSRSPSLLTSCSSQDVLAYYHLLPPQCSGESRSHPGSSRTARTKNREERFAAHINLIRCYI